MKKELLDKIKNSIKENIIEKKIGIAFSGGVDSTLISKICSDLGYDVTLLTMVFQNLMMYYLQKKLIDS